MKITRQENPYLQTMAKPSELLREAKQAAQRRQSTVEGKADGPRAEIQRRPENDPKSAAHKVEAAKREFERRPEYPSQFIDKTV